MYPRNAKLWKPTNTLVLEKPEIMRREQKEKMIWNLSNELKRWWGKAFFENHFLDFFIFHPSQDCLVSWGRWDLEKMKNDHQDSRVPDELLLGEKLEGGGSKMNGRTMTGVDKSRLRQFSVEQNAKIFVKCLLKISLGCGGWCGWESDIKKRPTWIVEMGSGEVSEWMRTCRPRSSSAKIRVQI